MAIACRLRSAYPVASTLSGGLDSSSVSCVARNLLREQDNQASLLTIYADCGVPSTDEKNFVNTVLAQGGFKHHIAQVTSPISSAQIVTPWIDQPVQMPTPAMLLAIIQSVQQQGARVMLTGHDGDTIVSHGQDYPHELIELGELDYLEKLAETQVKNRKTGTDSSLAKGIELELYKYALPYLKENTKGFNFKGYVKSLKLLSKVSKRWQFLTNKVLYLLMRGAYRNLQIRNAYQSLRNLRGSSWKSSNQNIEFDFAHQINLGRLLQDEVEYQSAYLPSEYLNHYQGITSDNLLDSTEQVDGISAALGIEPRHPFLDKRLVELCLAVPAHLKFCHGFGRGVMRRAMKDILPEDVRRRGSKVDFYGFIISEMETDERSLIEGCLLEKNSELSRYLDTDALYREYQDFSKSAAPWKSRRRRARMIACAMFLSMWLRQSKDCA
ncbi:MAG: asparagine synthase [Symploca sp. SIO2B6]|nr:asparagine synthase [Symploca sp. SIO2B6]